MTKTLKEIWETNNSRNLPFDSVFCKNSPYTNKTALKKFLVRYHFVNRCAICLINEWQGKPLTLQLDHIDGDNSNHTPNNLRLICPNCHSQTETFGKSHPSKRMYVSDDKFVGALIEFGNIRRALRHVGLQAHGANYDRAKALAADHNITLDSTPISSKRISKGDLISTVLNAGSICKASQSLSISTRAMRNWLSIYGLPTVSSKLLPLLRKGCV